MLSEQILDHFRNPRHVGEVPEPRTLVEVENPACGDVLRLSVRFANDIVDDVRYQTRGCTASIAAGSVLTEWMLRKTRSELMKITPTVIDDALGGLAPESRHVASLCV